MAAILAAGELELSSLMTPVRANGVAVRADELALLDLSQEASHGITPLNTVGYIERLFCPRQMIPTHRREMEASSAISTRLRLHLSDEIFDRVDSFLGSPSNFLLVSLVPRGVECFLTRLAHALVARASSMEVA